MGTIQNRRSTGEQSVPLEIPQRCRPKQQKLVRIFPDEKPSPASVLRSTSAGNLLQDRKWLIEATSSQSHRPGKILCTFRTVISRYEIFLYLNDSQSVLDRRPEVEHRGMGIRLREEDRIWSHWRPSPFSRSSQSCAPGFPRSGVQSPCA